MTLCAKRVMVFRKAPRPPVRYLSTTMNRSPIALACAFAFAACNQGPSSSAAVADPAPATAPAAPTTPASPATPTGGPAVRLGAAISAPEVALADIAKDPD